MPAIFRRDRQEVICPFASLVFACAWLLIVGGIPVVGAQNSAYTVYLPLVIRDATYRTGEGTYYNADGTGNCSFDPSPEDLMVAAMNHADYDNAALCGAFIEVMSVQKGRVVRCALLIGALNAHAAMWI
jgi:hypothetical protein